MKIANKYSRSGISFVATLVTLFAFADLIAPTGSQAQSIGFGHALQVIAQAKDVADNLTAGFDASLNAMDAVAGKSSKGDQFSNSQFGNALAGQLHALDHVRVPGPPDLSAFAVSYGDIADPATRCQGYKKLQNGVDALRQWQTGNQEALNEGKDLQDKLDKADKARRKLAEGTEWCAVNPTCGSVLTSVWEDSDVAKDISNAQSAVKHLVESAEKDQIHYSADVKKKLGEYEEAVNWVKTKVSNIDKICQQQDELYSKQETEDEPLRRFLDAQDSSSADRQVSDYLASLDSSLADLRAQLQAEWDRIERDKQEKLAQIAQSFAGVQQELLNGLMVAQAQQLQRNNAQCSAIAAQIQANKKWLGQVAPNQSQYAGGKETVNQVRRATDENARQYRLRGC